MYIYRINALKKYSFALLVLTYLVTAAGIPIYLHYCGGELEEVSYVVKTNDCCGDAAGQDGDNGCCRDKDVMLVNDEDFIVKHSDLDLTQTFSHHLFFILPWCSERQVVPGNVPVRQFSEGRPPALVQTLIVNNSVLRI